MESWKQKEVNGELPMTEAQTARPFLRFAGLPDCDTGTLKVSNGSAGNIIIGRNTVDVLSEGFM